MAVVSLQNVSLSFGGLPVLDRISMQIEPGERVCLVGRNGEGKSSLMRLIAGELMAVGFCITITMLYYWRTSELPQVSFGILPG